MSENPVPLTPEQQMSAHFFGFVRKEFEKDEWGRIMDALERGGRRSPRRNKDKAPPGGIGREETWLSHGRHSGVVAMRVAKVLDLLEITGEVRKDAVAAAMVHDLTKPIEITHRGKTGVTWNYYDKVTDLGDQILKEEGFSDQVIWLANSMGHASLVEAKTMLEKGDYTSEKIAWLAIHGADDMSNGEKAAAVGIFQERIAKGRNALHLKALNDEGRERVGGNTHDIQREVGLKVFELLARKLSEKTGDVVTVDDLPLYIDRKIREDINK